MKTFGIVLMLLLIISTAVAQLPKSLFESFEGTWAGGAPSGWTKTNVVGSAEWAQQITPLSGQQPPLFNAARHGIAVAWFATNVAPGSTTRLESPSVDLSTVSNARLRFFYVNATGMDTLRIVVSTDGGTSWTILASRGTTPSNAWAQQYVNLASVIGQVNVKIGFEATADSGTSDMWVDKVLVQYPEVTVRQIQQTPLDSLLAADTIQASNPARWTLQASPFNGDTVTVTALCVVPAKIFGFTASGFTMLLYDTASTFEWKGLFVRVNAPQDTALAILDGILNVQVGDVIKMTGRVSEFPSGFMNSLTQLQPIPGIPIQIFSSAPILPPPQLSASTFYNGLFPGGTVRFSTGEQYESMIVQLSSLIVPSYLNTANGTFNMVQSSNMISDYDASKWFTYRIWRDPSSTYVLPPINATIDTIRGAVWVVSGSENPRGYRIAPVYPGDLFVGVSLPRVTSQRRYPIEVPSDSAARINVRVFKQEAGYDIDTVELYYSLNNGPFTAVGMALVDAVDSIYEAIIPNQPENTFVKYFIKGFDLLNNSTTLASFSFNAGNDTSQGFFFYTALNRPLTIYDIQHTPFANGYSAYAEDYPFGATVTVSGIVTADTSDIRISPRPGNVGGTNAWYMQTSDQPWNGIWIVGVESTMASLRRGDSITVTGTVQEWSSSEVILQPFTTRITDIQYPATVHSAGNPVAAPVLKTTGDFGPGAANAEPYEGMLVKFNNVAVSDTNPYFSDPAQYEISDGSGGVWVHRDGTNTYTNLAAESTDVSWHVLRVGDMFASMTGIIHFSVNRYKFVPRSNADFEPITGVVSRDNVLPVSFDLAQNYPNPFNPSTAIQYDIPAASFVTLKIYNILGQEIATIVNEEQIAGRYTARFDASSLASGVYFYRLNAGGFVSTKKMLLLK